jgi:hypothetical protein
MNRARFLRGRVRGVRFAYHSGALPLRGLYWFGWLLCFGSLVDALRKRTAVFLFETGQYLRVF